MSHDDALRHVPAADAPIHVRHITLHDLGYALHQGYEDFAARPSFGAFLLLIYPLAALLFVLFLQSSGQLAYLAFPIVAGLALLGPAVSVALFEMSRRREAGLPSSWRAAFGWVRSASFAPILGLSLLMMLLYVAWLALAESLYLGTLGAAQPTFGDFLVRLFTTREGAALMLYGNVCGLLFAFTALAMSVIAFPLLLERPVSLLSAVGASVRAVASNLGVMLLWGLLVTVLLLAGAAVFLVGLAAVLPILGHATWHLYRCLVAPPSS